MYLVGAGPGHPELLTLRAVRCLARADLVLYDRLVPARVLDFAPATAERVCVTELAGAHAERCPEVTRTLLDAARAGRRVVRLKGGDPMTFGRAAEEAEALRQAGIPFEIVPGVTAASGAAAYAGIPLTHRNLASAVAFVAGHEDAAKGAEALDWSALARFPGTLVIYMGLARLAHIAEALVAGGLSGDTASAAVRMATTGEQRTVRAPLRDLPARVREARLTSPAVVLIGPAASLGPALDWAQRRPLFGKRVVVTRPRGQLAELVARLEELGAVPLLLPLVEIREPADWGPTDRALAKLGDYDWLVFTSANGVDAVVRRLRQTGRDLRALGLVKLAAIGPGTAAALRRYELEPDVVPAEYRSESLAEALRDRVAGRRVLLARADRGRDVLARELGRVADVEQVAVYAQVDSTESDLEVWQALGRGEVDYVTLTSSNIARAFARGLDDPGRAAVAGGRTKVVTISPVTTKAAAEAGLAVAAEAEEYTSEGIVRALVRLVEAGRG